jgi:putative ABC transport system ATP-binding protein
LDNKDFESATFTGQIEHVNRKEIHSNILITRSLRYAYAGQPAIEFPNITCQREGRLLITGNSGRGKTTLLHLISGLLRVQFGEILLEGQNLAGLSQKELDLFRGRHIGLVFQQPRFIGALTVLDNVCAAQFFGKRKSDRMKATHLLGQLGIAQYASKSTGQLSGGERQRLAIACALASQPSVVMADEPTSSLDDQNAEAVYALISKECAMNGAALIVVSHDQRLKDKFENRVEL